MAPECFFDRGGERQRGEWFERFPHLGSAIERSWVAKERKPLQTQMANRAWSSTSSIVASRPTSWTSTSIWAPTHAWEWLIRAIVIPQAQTNMQSNVAHGFFTTSPNNVNYSTRCFSEASAGTAQVRTRHPDAPSHSTPLALARVPRRILALQLCFPLTAVKPADTRIGSARSSPCSPASSWGHQECRRGMWGAGTCMPASTAGNSAIGKGERGAGEGM